MNVSQYNMLQNCKYTKKILFCIKNLISRTWDPQKDSCHLLMITMNLLCEILCWDTLSFVCQIKNCCLLWGAHQFYKNKFPWIFPDLPPFFPDHKITIVIFQIMSYDKLLMHNFQWKQKLTVDVLIWWDLHFLSTWHHHDRKIVCHMALR